MLNYIRCPHSVTGGNLKVNKLDIKALALTGVVWTIIQTLISCGIFVTFRDMVAYAAPKDDLTTIEKQLNRIEEKVDTLILKIR